MTTLPFPDKATVRRQYGKQKATNVADATGQGVLRFGSPPVGIVWVIHRVFIRSAAGMTVRLIVGSDPGDPAGLDPQDEVDAVSANPAVNSTDEIEVESLEQVWALITGVAAGTICSGQIRYRQMIVGDNLF
jgi:hypothetical protein